MNESAGMNQPSTRENIMCSPVTNATPLLVPIPKVITFPIHTLANDRKTVAKMALGSTPGMVVTENLHATTDNGLFSSATVILDEGYSAVSPDSKQALGLIAGALGAIGSAVLPTLINVGIDLVKKVIDKDDAAMLSFDPASVASVNAVMRLGDPSNPAKLYEIGRFGFECTPNSVIASATPPAPASSSSAILPESFGSLAACLLAEGGTTLFNLLKDNVGQLSGFDSVAFRRFLNAVLAQSGAATVELIQRSIANCLATKP